MNAETADYFWPLRKVPAELKRRYGFKVEYRHFKQAIENGVLKVSTHEETETWMCSNADIENVARHFCIAD